MTTNNDEDYVICPLYNHEITDWDCYETCLVQDGELPITDVPEKIRKPGWKKIVVNVNIIHFKHFAI